MTAHPPTHTHTRTHTHKQYVYTYTHKRTNTNTCTPDQTHYRALCTLHHRTTYVSGPSPLLGVSRRLDLPVKEVRIKSGTKKPGGGRTVAVTGAEGRYMLVMTLIPSNCREDEREDRWGRPGTLSLTHTIDITDCRHSHE